MLGKQLEENLERYFPYSSNLHSLYNNTECLENLQIYSSYNNQCPSHLPVQVRHSFNAVKMEIKIWRWRFW
jgi:hypothetical protein